ncbi:hypothetical protein BS78_07G014100 [Paspalum vaginatum]|nr:hypothetical protein BS78_07G014100 [Paspalum vaginatum]
MKGRAIFDAAAGMLIFDFSLALDLLFWRWPSVTRSRTCGVSRSLSPKVRLVLFVFWPLLEDVNSDSLKIQLEFYLNPLWGVSPRISILRKFQTGCSSSQFPLNTLASCSIVIASRFSFTSGIPKVWQELLVFPQQRIKLQTFNGFKLVLRNHMLRL